LIEYAVRRWINPEAFGMHGQRSLPYLLVLRRIDDRYAAATEADEHAAGLAIETNVIRIPAQIDARDRRIVGSAKHAHRTVARIRDEDRVRFRDIGDSLRLDEARYAMRQLVAREIDHSHRVVAQLRHEQTPTRHVDGHVVNSTCHITERDLGIDRKRNGLPRLFLAQCRAGDNQESQTCERDTEAWGRKFRCHAQPLQRRTAASRFRASQPIEVLVQVEREIGQAAGERAAAIESLGSCLTHFSMVGRGPNGSVGLLSSILASCKHVSNST
jgi:hypothetical protein